MLTPHPGSPHSFAGNETSAGALCPPPFSFPATAVTTFNPSFGSTTQLICPSSHSSADTWAPSTPPFVGETTAERTTSFLAPAASTTRRHSSSRPPTFKNRSRPYPQHTKPPSRLDSSSISLAPSSQNSVGRIAESSIGHTEEARRDKLRERNRLSKRAQRQRQVDHLAALKVKAEQQEGELAELRAELRSKEQVIAMLWERLRDSGKA